MAQLLEAKRSTPDVRRGRRTGGGPERTAGAGRTSMPSPGPALSTRRPGSGGATCPGHEPGEVARSRTQAGHLTPDVRAIAAGAFVVSDFGVGRGALKASTRREPDFTTWRATFDANAAYRLKIFGFSDCVGDRARNVQLRDRRAQAVHEALTPGTRRRVVQKGPFDPGLFLVGNRTVEERATNRGVLVAYTQQHTFEGDDIEGSRDLLDRVIDQSVKSLSPSPYDQEFMRCWIEGVRDPSFDRLYVNGFRWALHTQELEPPGPYRTLLEKRTAAELLRLGIVVDIRKELVDHVVPGEDPKKTYRYLRGMAARYHKGTRVAAKISGKYAIGGGSAVNPGDRQLIDHIAATADRPSIHRCYRTFYEGG